MQHLWHLYVIYISHNLTYFIPTHSHPPPTHRTGQMYYMFGFVFLAFLILILVCAETSVLLCYFHLCSEDYRWWWRSFFSTATTVFYVFLFILHYFYFKTSIVGLLSYILYFGYTFIAMFLLFMMTGKCWCVRVCVCYSDKLCVCVCS